MTEEDKEIVADLNYIIGYATDLRIMVEEESKQNYIGYAERMKELAERVVKKLLKRMPI